MKWLWQTALLLAVSVCITLLTYHFVGAPDRSVPCDQDAMPEWEVCLDHVGQTWDGNVIWVDARTKEEWIADRVKGALLIPETDIDEALFSFGETLFLADQEGAKVVVYCATDACGGSHVVADAIRNNGLHSEVYILHGGWKAIQAARMSQ